MSEFKDSMIAAPPQKPAWRRSTQSIDLKALRQSQTVANLFKPQGAPETAKDKEKEQITLSLGFSLSLKNQEEAPDVPSDVMIPEGTWLFLGKNPGEYLSSGLNLMLPIESVSRLHAAITVQDGDIYLYDYQSSNGTFIISRDGFNQISDGPHKLPAGSHIALGSVVLSITEKIDILE